jgi:capsular exopolysaccharide synthesis family protein
VALHTDDHDTDFSDEPRPTGRPAPGLLTVLGRRWPLVLLGLVAGLFLGALYYLQKSPVYQSISHVLVTRKQTEAMTLPGGGSEGRAVYVEDYLGTHARLIESQRVLEQAARELRREPAFGLPLDDRGDGLKQALTVVRDKDAGTGTGNNILVLSFRSPNPEDCPKALDAIVKSYSDYLRGAYDRKSDETAKLLKDWQRIQEGQLQEAIRRRNEALRDSPGAQALADQLTQRRDALRTKELKRESLELRLTELKSRLDTIEKLQAQGLNRAGILRVINAAGERLNGGELKTAEDALLTLNLILEEKQQYLGEAHPEVKSLKKRIQMAEQARQQLEAGTAGGPNGRKLDALDVVVATNTAERDESRRQLETLDGLITAERSAVQQMQQKFGQLDAAEKEVKHWLDTQSEIQTKLSQINLLREAGGFDAAVITPPGPGLKVAPNLFQSLAISGLAGLLVFGLGLAYLAELTDKSFRTPEEIRVRLGLPVVGHVPPIPLPAGANLLPLDATLCAYHRPKSLEAESYRGVRTALYFSTHGRGHQVVQVTSPSASDGKSTLAANLAVSIAQSGKRVVLVDADFRRPRVHQLFRLEGPQPGLAGVIAGEASLASAVQECEEVPNLWLLPCGPRPANPAELLTSPRFQELLAEIRGRFDFVLVDTPPVLAVSDPSVVAPRVDGVLLTIRVVKNGRPAAERAKEVLASLGANILGVVVNGYAGPEGTSGYGYYHHGYGYHEGYTTEDEETPALPAKG